MNNIAKKTLISALAAVTNYLRDSRGHTAQAWARTGDSRTAHGFTARLYQRVHLTSINQVSRQFLTGATLAAIALFTGKPASVVRGILQRATLAAGASVISNNVTMRTDRITVTYSREGRIAPYPGPWSTDERGVQYDVTRGDNGATSRQIWSSSFVRTVTQTLDAAINSRRQAN